MGGEFIGTWNRRRRVDVEGNYEVYSWTRVGAGEIQVDRVPVGFEFVAPYVLAIVVSKEGERLLVQLTDLEVEPEMGMEVRPVVRRLRVGGPEDLIEYGVKFRPAREVVYKPPLATGVGGGIDSGGEINDGVDGQNE